MTTASASSTGPLAYQVIKCCLARGIGTRWRAGSRLPPIAELARDLGTGQRNTHRAVQELVRDGILVSRPGMGTFVRGEFQASQLPQSTANRAFELDIAAGPSRLVSKRITLVRHTATVDGFQSRIAETVIQQLNSRGAPAKQVVLPERAPAAEVEAVFADADALVLINPGRDTPIRPREGQIMAVVTTGLDVDLHATRGVDFVSVDQVGGAMLAGQRLREAGCEAVCYIGVCKDSRSPSRHYDTTSQVRLNGFERGWGEEVAARHRLYVPFYDVGAGARMVPHFLKLSPRPMGVFCVSDELAAGFAIGGLAAGIEPGTDYKLIGFDGQPLGRGVSEGPLTTVDVPLEEMGRRAVELMIDRFDDPDQPVRRLALGCRLFEGNTVDVPPVRLSGRTIWRQLYSLH